MSTPTGLPELDAELRGALVDVARRSILEMLAGRDFAPPTPDRGSVLARRDGVFVTLKSGGRLRGCIGHIEASELIPVSVAKLARAAAREDPRFDPVVVDEVDGLEIEVTLLSPLERIHGPDEVEIGRHGLVIEQGYKRGLLLPQVATEHGWSAEVFLEQTCWKAGLPPDAWRRGAGVYRFEGVVFGER
ncbi:MAG: AmmeMemoRadiSam system protein A [Myxococcota bacterium]|jgi:AmmeMemoRadiSam system protein A|nr:AmmeMemoRadiSam system protein A [Myxococcota bacterium]